MTAEQIAIKTKRNIRNVYDGIKQLRNKGIKIQSKKIDNKSEGFLVKNAPMNEI